MQIARQYTIIYLVLGTIFFSGCTPGGGSGDPTPKVEDNMEPIIPVQNLPNTAAGSFRIDDSVRTAFDKYNSNLHRCASGSGELALDQRLRVGSEAVTQISQLKVDGTYTGIGDVRLQIMNVSPDLGSVEIKNSFDFPGLGPAWYISACSVEKITDESYSNTKIFCNVDRDRMSDNLKQAFSNQSNNSSMSSRYCYLYAVADETETKEEYGYYRFSDGFEVPAKRSFTVNTGSLKCHRSSSSSSSDSEFAVDDGKTIEESIVTTNVPDFRSYFNCHLTTIFERKKAFDKNNGLMSDAYFEIKSYKQ